MANDVVSVWNMALNAAASKGLVSDTAEQSREADLCRLWYDRVRRKVLKAASWPCAKKHARLGLLAERGLNASWTSADPDPTFVYQYAEPADSLAPRNLSDFSRFSRGVREDQRTINCNQKDALLHYVTDQEDVNLWDEALTMVIVDTLAARISMSLTGKTFLYDRLARQAMDTIIMMQTELANEADNYFEESPSWHVARGYQDIRSEPKFFFPHEGLLGMDQ